jgi:glycogen operon protein
LGRTKGIFDPGGTFLGAVRQDPVLSRVKLIAEPWDLGHDGYQLGRFPPGWSEWNDDYRDTVRSFWKGTGGLIGDLAYALTGSSQRFEHRGRQPRSSVNYVTAHDGFTLADLVTYQRKYNAANHENSRDGSDENLSWNCGVEGPTDAAAVNRLRFQQKRNFMATLLLSQGVPMLLAGDELGRTQMGNNNAYCQDNEISWLDWSLPRPEDKEFLEFVKTLTRIRRLHPVFRRPRFFHGNYTDHSPVKDITWLSPDGRELNDDEWRLSYGRCFGFHLGGDTGEYFDRTGRSLIDDRFIVLLNAHDDMVPFMMPDRSLGTEWRVLVDSARPVADSPRRLVVAKEDFDLLAHSLVLMIHEGSVHWSEER